MGAVTIINCLKSGEEAVIAKVLSRRQHEMILTIIEMLMPRVSMLMESNMGFKEQNLTTKSTCKFDILSQRMYVIFLQAWPMRINATQSSRTLQRSSAIVRCMRSITVATE